MERAKFVPCWFSTGDSASLGSNNIIVHPCSLGFDIYQCCLDAGWREINKWVIVINPPMDKAEKTHQWKMTVLVVVGALFAALIGGLFSLLGSYYVLDQQQKVMNQQQTEEQQNIAQALYTDISKIESNFNYSLSHIALNENNTSKLEGPNSFRTTTIQYYDDKGLYYDFRHDISGFDSITSKDIFNFYGIVEDIERKRGRVLTIVEKHLRGEEINQFDIILAHRYSKGIYETKMPYSITLAEKIKNELTQKYNAKSMPPQYIVIDSQPQTFYLMDGQMQVYTF